MDGRERTIRFLEGDKVDRYPIHPLVMQYACRLSGITYEEYCLDYRKQSEAMVYFAENYGMDSVHAAGFAWCEAMDYGLSVVYQGDSCPYPDGYLIENVETDLEKIRRMDIEKCPSMMNRVEGIRHYRKLTGNRYFLEGHCEGPLAEYADLRSLERTFLDLFDYPDKVKKAMEILVENAKDWITLQIQAGADVISIGDAACSQIGRELYREFVLPFHRELISYIRNEGAYAKLHICGDITPILEDVISTGVNIIDVDSMVDLGKYVDWLGKKQVFCGNLDPAGLFAGGNPSKMKKAVEELIQSVGQKCILAGGCEIPPDTKEENYRAFVEAVWEYSDT